MLINNAISRCYRRENMLAGIVLFISGVLLVVYFSNFKIEKRFLTEIAIIVGVIITIYGLILIVQPKEDNYIKFTKTTISKQDSNNSK